ncbi:MAG: alpha/beta hydrolase domain-containing protein, partial [Burkholderiaceae bacterium]
MSRIHAGCACAAGIAVAIAALGGTDAEARITRIVVDRTEALTDGSGYERLHGRAFGEVDPDGPDGATITDLRGAPRNARGQVEYVATFGLLKPVDMARASGVLWYELVNRGNALRTFDPLTGDGHVTLVSGWQGDLAQTGNNFAVKVPLARQADGSPITGAVMARLADAKAGTASRPLAMLANAIPYDAATLDTREARLVTKQGEQRSGVAQGVTEVPATDWAFADCSQVPFPGLPNPRMLCIKGGFDPALLYELTYRAKDPMVLGLGLAAIRDVAAFFRRAAADDDGTPNPLAGRVRWAIAHGTSQSGNALKTFLLQGFNDDGERRIVFDGANPHIAGRLTAVNVRFGLPSGSGTLYEPGGEGALWWETYRDAARGREPAGLLDRCRATDTCPQIFETFGAAEFNARLMTVALTGTDGKADLPLPANVRRYYFPGTTHGGDDDGGFDPAPQALAACDLPKNPNPEKETMAALRQALIEWVAAGREPPPSRYPTLAAGQLVANTAEAMGWPRIAGAPLPTGMAIGLLAYDYGPSLDYNRFTGVLDRWPPTIAATIAPLMPRLDADGNEVGGVPSMLHQLPLGTYTGWNITRSGFFKGQPCGGGLTGGYVPFARTAAERAANGDPRLSLEERYGSMRGYHCAVRAIAERDVADRFLLAAGARRLGEQVAKSTMLPAEAATPVARRAEQRLCGPPADGPPQGAAVATPVATPRVTAGDAPASDTGAAPTAAAAVALPASPPPARVTPPPDCSTWVGVDRMVEMPGYRLPRPGGDAVCVPFLQTANKPPPGYRGSDYYVAEFTDDRLKARWAECKADNACRQRIDGQMQRWLPPNKARSTRVTGLVDPVGKIEPDGAVDLRAIRRPAFFAREPYAERVAEAEPRTWTVEFTVPRDPLERLKLGMGGEIRLRGWYVEGAGVDDGRGARRRALVVMSPGGGGQLTAIRNPADVAVKLDPATNQATEVRYPNATTEGFGMRGWRESLYALNQAGFDVLAYDRRGEGLSGGFSDTNTLEQGEDIFRVLAQLETGRGLRLLAPDGRLLEGPAAAGRLMAGQPARAIPLLLLGNSRGSMATGWAMTSNYAGRCSYDLPQVECESPKGWSNIRGAILFASFVSGAGYVPQAHDLVDRTLFLGGMAAENHVVFYPNSAVLAAMDRWPAVFFAKGLWDRAESLEGTVAAYDRVNGLKEIVVVRGPHSIESWPEAETTRARERMVAFARAAVNGESSLPGARPWADLRELVATTP